MAAVELHLQGGLLRRAQRTRSQANGSAPPCSRGGVARLVPVAKHIITIAIIAIAIAITLVIDASTIIAHALRVAIADRADDASSSRVCCCVVVVDQQKHQKKAIVRVVDSRIESYVVGSLAPALHTTKKNTFFLSDFFSVSLFCLFDSVLEPSGIEGFYNQRTVHLIKQKHTESFHVILEPTFAYIMCSGCFPGEGCIKPPQRGVQPLELMTKWAAAAAAADAAADAADALRHRFRAVDNVRDSMPAKPRRQRPPLKILFLSASSTIPPHFTRSRTICQPPLGGFRVLGFGFGFRLRGLGIRV